MILCCGEALIDMIPIEAAQGGSGFQPHAGGAIFNTAIALGRLGRKTSFLSGISTDLFGALLRRSLAESHVDTEHAILSDRPTTLAFVELTNGQASYTFYDENTAGRALTPDMLPETLPDAVDALYFGGISLISEPCADFYAALAETAAQEHVVMLDPNIRTGFIKDASGYRARLNRMIAAADIIKVSDEDLDWIIPGDEDLAEKAASLAAGKLVIVTRGSAGALAWLADGTALSVPAREVDVVDTVGAGDTFNAGFLAHLAHAGALQKATISALPAETVENALRLGGLVAAVTVSRAGANPPWASEIDGIEQFI